MPAGWRGWAADSGPVDRMERPRCHWDRQARSYDRQIAFFERTLFGDGRQWICSQAAGDVLEVAIGSGRNPASCPQGIRLTGIDFSPQMLQLAQRRAEELGRQVELRLGTPRRWICRMPPTTRWSAPCRCASSRMSGKRSPR
jgi:SAM-dependent methyltransferase